VSFRTGAPDRPWEDEIVSRNARADFAKIGSILEIPDLLDVQLTSFRAFLQVDVSPDERRDEGLQGIFNEIFPIEDVHGKFSLEYVGYQLGQPKYNVDECQDKGATYAAPLKAELRLVTREEVQGEKRPKDVIQQWVFLGELPLMTDRGSFIVNGVERVIVSQLHRSPGVFFSEDVHSSGKKLHAAQIIPYRGSWVEFSIDASDIMYVHIDRRRKLPATLLLRVLGYPSNADILKLFFETKKVRVAVSEPEDTSPLLDRVLAEDVIDQQTGEVIAEANEAVTPSIIARIKGGGVKRIEVVEEGAAETELLQNTLNKDDTRSADEALSKIYLLMRSTSPPSLEAAASFFDKLFFSPRRYNLGSVGRYKINRRLGLDIPGNRTTLAPEDLVATVRYLFRLREGKGTVDDIDHLGNRRVRCVGELLANQFSLAFSRMARTIREKMTLRGSEKITPQDLVNARMIQSIIMSFFASSQLSQFMEQTNPLAELTHKRRLSALGPGGLTRETAGFEVRDVHHSHYGRICPIETPEGPNIGLISSLSTFARVNEYGFIETPYRQVQKGRVTGKIVYLTADEEDQYTIAQANAPLDSSNRLNAERVLARHRGDFPLAKPEDVDFIDVSPMQLVSVAAALIPFLEHDDANRALMGSNMQRQAVPLLVNEAPIVGTGIERKVAVDSGSLVTSPVNGTILRATASEIWIRPDSQDAATDPFSSEDYTIRRLIKFRRSNQDTSINQRTLVCEGDRVKTGSVIADGPGTIDGELALGTNVLIAFMPWGGYNFEDAIVVSEKLIREDRFTSIHIEEFEVEVRETKLGPEEITREIPNVGEEALKNLDEDGIVRIGAEVGPDDILVGKISPKGETELTPEERLVRAIFGEKASDVRDSSLRVPPGVEGIIVDVRMFSRRDQAALTRKVERKKTARIKKEYKGKIDAILDRRDTIIRDLLLGRTALSTIRTIEGDVAVRKGGKFSDRVLGKIDWDKIDLPEKFVRTPEVNEQVFEIIDKARSARVRKEREFENEIEKLLHGDELPHGVLKVVKVFVAQKRKLAVGDKIAGRHGNKGVVAKVVPEEDMPYLPDGTPVEIILNPLGVPSRMNVGQILEAHLGWAAKTLGMKIASPVFEGITIEEIKGLLEKSSLPESGKTVLYDGRTGEPFDEEITVGYIYMLKLSHMVDDKIHARAIGPYSLITQQPLGGKAQFGGQRFGEMEVWALEAYGAAYTLQELLTVKSDDVMGRSKLYEAIVKGENPPEPGLPASFNVLVKELQGLCLDVELEGEE
jgi:DNA-directed RNA polymerase subunit beta